MNSLEKEKWNFFFLPDMIWCLVLLCPQLPTASLLDEFLCEGFFVLLSILRTSLALTEYREMIGDGAMPTSEVVSKILGCLRLPYDASLKDRLIETLGVNAETPRSSNLCSLVDGFGEYDPRAFSILEVSRNWNQFYTFFIL